MLVFYLAVLLGKALLFHSLLVGYYLLFFEVKIREHLLVLLLFHLL